jgi:hypothetical protein
MTVDGLAMSEAVTSVVETPVAWAGDKYEYDVESFDAWTGYWVKNMTDSAVVLRIPPTETVDPAETLEAPPYSPTARKQESSGEWFMAITASSVCAKDPYNYVGVKTEAANHWDRHDRSEPPMGPGKSVSLYFPHPAWEKHPGNYTVDIRGEFQKLDVDASPFSLPPDLQGQMWPFDVAKNFSAGSAGDEVVLTFAGVEQVPDECMIILVDRTLERRIDLREQDQYVFFHGVRNILSKAEDARFVLMVGSEDFLVSHEHEIPKLPARTVLHQNRPNPFNPSTVIRYDLAEPGRVALRIYDVNGAFVKTIESCHHEPGRYELGWNGDDERGTKVATGVYFYKLTTKDFTQTKKMLLLK